MSKDGFSLLEVNKSILEVEARGRLARAKERARIASMSAKELYTEKRNRAIEFNIYRRKQRELDEKAVQEADLQKLWNSIEDIPVSKGVLIELAAGLAKGD